MAESRLLNVTYEKNSQTIIAKSPVFIERFEATPTFHNRKRTLYLAISQIKTDPSEPPPHLKLCAYGNTCNPRIKVGYIRRTMNTKIVKENDFKNEGDMVFYDREGIMYDMTKMHDDIFTVPKYDDIIREGMERRWCERNGVDPAILDVAELIIDE